MSSERGRVLSNTSWILLHRAIRIVVGFLLGIWLARYLGAANFGTLSFGLSWAALFAVVAQMGLPNIVTRELVSRPGEQGLILGSALVLRFIGAGVGLVLAVSSYLLVFGSADQDVLLIVALTAGSQLFLALEVIDYWYRSEVAWRAVFIPRLLAFAAASGFKVLCILQRRPVEWFAAATTVDAALTATLLAIRYRRSPDRPRGLRGTRNAISMLVRESWPLLVSALAIVVYTRIDQVMIGSLLSREELGNYSVAVKVSSVWYVLPSAFTQSMLPGIVRARAESTGRYQCQLMRLLGSLFWVSVGASIVATVIAPRIVPLLVGDDFTQAGRVLQVHFWAGVFVAIGIGARSWLLAEGLQRYSVHRTVAGAVSNVILNAVLIPRAGLVGAAAATVVSQIVATYLSFLWIPKGRVILGLLHRAIVSPRLLLGSD